MQSGACIHDRPLQVHQQLYADLHRSRRRRVFITKPLQALNNGPVRGKKEKEKNRPMYTAEMPKFMCGLDC